MRVTITVVVSVVLMVVTMALFSAGMHVVELGGQWLKSELGGGEVWEVFLVRWGIWRNSLHNSANAQDMLTA